ncbi:MAG: uncharacterized protein QOD77_1520 [Thermoplasmata archaeon]|jgi:predicted enzyme related to lactoylglutathione lyase|nr:uncharacterized protein [Thermoplasmata archaeon]
MAARKSAKKAKPAKSAKAAKPVRKAAPKKAAVQATRKIRPGFISHTELVSSDPAATKAWAAATFGWDISSMPMPGGSPYHMWRFNEGQGGGIRANNPPEAPGTIAYVEVPDIKAGFAKALKGGAREMLAPMAIPGGGWMAIVQAPGGPAVGLWGTK